MKTFSPNLLPFKAKCIICKKQFTREAYQYQGPYITGDIEYALNCDRPNDLVHYQMRFGNDLSIIGEFLRFDGFTIINHFVENKVSINYKTTLNNMTIHLPSVIENGTDGIRKIMNFS